MDLGLGIGLVDAAVCQLVRANNADAFFHLLFLSGNTDDRRCTQTHNPARDIDRYNKIHTETEVYTARTLKR